ncbi:hypothetical protein [Streptomyces sp. NPDC058145]|uniref:hypothetical protein n=1 Tax=Streptomyces sp. NPDC058145 TaxID=3346356 RepID=UPI0036E71367
MTASGARSRGKSGGVLARRKAVLQRAAARVAEQRRVAAEAEAERLRREAVLDELAADFELALEDEQAVATGVEEEVRRVRVRGRVRIEAARSQAARVVWAMGEAGETVAGCGHRLGVGVERIKELRRLAREAVAGEEPGAEGAGAARGASAGGEQGRDGVRAAGPAGGERVATPPAGAARVAGSAEGAESPGSVGGARPGWPESQ